MPSRRRSKAQAPIRKRRSKQKQTLAKVAERRDAREAALAHRLEVAEERQRARKAALTAPEASTSMPFAQEEQQDNRPKSHSSTEGPLGEQDDGQDMDAACAHAFDALVSTLKRCPESTASRLRTNQNIDTAEKPRAKPSRPSQVEPSVASIPKMAEEPQPAPPPDAAAIDVACRAMAKREAAHFSSSFRPAAAPEKAPRGENVALPAAPALRLTAYGLSPTAVESLKAAFTPDALSSPLPAGVALGLQPRLQAKWQDLPQVPESAELRALTAGLAAFHDMLLAAPLDPRAEDAARRIVVSHAVSHVVRARDRVARNNSKLRRAMTGEGDEMDAGAAASDGEEAEEEKYEDPDAIRDQGFSRPRVLFLLPMRNVAYEVVKTIIALVVGDDNKKRGGVQAANSERFEQEFAPDPAEEEEDDMSEDDESAGNQDGGLPEGKPKRKPADYRRTFRGNIDDDFRLGLSISHKGVRLFTDFYDSDIIIASPLGLRRASAERAAGVDAATRARRRERERERDTEWKTGLESDGRQRNLRDKGDNAFLSSIEVAVVDGAHVFSMQNWDSLTRTMGALNRMPEDPRNTDFSRVRAWCLDGEMARFRQTVVLAQYRKSEFVRLFRSGANHAGAVALSRPTRGHCAIMDISVRMQKTFLRVPEVSSPADAPEKRLSFFLSRVLPPVRALVDSQCLLVTPSYFDFVRVRNRLLAIAEEDDSFRFASMSEYSRVNDISRARARLFDKKVSIVLMTERFHYFWRHWIRGANTIVWYGIPENAGFYAELLNMTAEAREAGRPVQSYALFDEYDAFALERIVGVERSKRMVSKSSRSTFVFT